MTDSARWFVAFALWVTFVGLSGCRSLDSSAAAGPRSVVVYHTPG